MKLHKFRLIAFFSFILVITSFSSCSDDDDRGYWLNGGYVDFRVEVETYNNGTFEDYIVLTTDFLRDANNRWVDPYSIDNWRIREEIDETFIEITNWRIYGNGYMDRFEIFVDGKSVYVYKGDPIELLGSDPAYIDDYESLDAAYYIVDRLIRFGEVEVVVRGRTNLLNAAEPIYFDFYNGVDFYIR